ncbi:toll/interleukin-1 receptor domain-containing protein [Catellatospora tritici]|uniref:toll/interleukin-1 receptor domain-containing protein n=1 Tax=Catellatospora tritici TaxID=2851566 RepID=UPI001C2DDFF7|nr:toll/interleukin-1 receptor domain-containing protein [Catellatospora tritici]MBV1855827.1 toll/interleukin-1 receptor domain-containing protein [Catellatospora tritici]
MGGPVFISYSHASDGGYVERLAAYLEAAGVAVWFDREIVSGDRWGDVIEARIESCTVYVVVMTPAAKASPW